MDESQKEYTSSMVNFPSQIASRAGIPYSIRAERSSLTRSRIVTAARRTIPNLKGMKFGSGDAWMMRVTKVHTSSMVNTTSKMVS